jgi:hypothetical protein
MNDTRTDQPAPHAGEREKGAGIDEDAAPSAEPGTRADGEALPPQAADPRPTGRPHARAHPAARARDTPGDADTAPSAGTADEALQHSENRLETIEGLTDNEAGG